MKRILILAVMSALTLAAFQNCTQLVKMNGDDESTSPSLGTGNAGGYGGKVFELVAAPGECPADKKIKERLVVRAGVEAELTTENCAPIAPVKVPLTELTLNARAPELLEYRGQAFTDVDRFKPRLSCRFSTTTTTTLIEHTVLVGQSGTDYRAIAHRFEKFGTGTRSLVTSHQVMAPVVDAAKPNLFSLRSSPSRLDLDDMDSAAFAANQDVRADVAYDLTFFDLATGADQPGVSASFPRSDCTVVP